MLYRIIKGKYLRGELTAAQVWAYADEGKISLAQAAEICGPRPKDMGEEDGDGEDDGEDTGEDDGEDTGEDNGEDDGEVRDE